MGQGKEEMEGTGKESDTGGGMERRKRNECNSELFPAWPCSRKILSLPLEATAWVRQHESFVVLGIAVQLLQYLGKTHFVAVTN